MCKPTGDFVIKLAVISVQTFCLSLMKYGIRGNVNIALVDALATIIKHVRRGSVTPPKNQFNKIQKSIYFV